MNNSAAKVGEIFREAGTAFNKLSEMTLMLQPMDDSPPGRKLSDAEVEMLRGCINRFAVELNKISQHIKNRTMRHLKCLLGMDSGTIQDIGSSSPLRPQHLHPAQQINIPETESQCDFNIFSEVFPENNNKDEDFDNFWHLFDPSEVNPTPPANIMQEDRIRQPSSEFEDLQDFSYDETLQAVPSLISLLDADVNNATPYSESLNPTESCMANIGTLHAVLPNHEYNLDEATGASSNFQELKYTSLVSREAHFSLRQAQDTWNHVSSPETNHTVIESEIMPPGYFILYTNTLLSCLQSPYIIAKAPDESALAEKMQLTESQYKPQLDNVSSLLAGNEAIKSIQSERILCPGSFSSCSLNNDPSEIIQARNDDQEGSSIIDISFTNFFRNSFHSANPGPITSVQAQTNFSSIRADTSVRRTRGCRGPGMPRRRREGPVTRASGVPIMSHDESKAEPIQGRMTRSSRRHVSHCDEIEDPVPKKLSRKNANTTSGPRTRAQMKKQSPTKTQVFLNSKI